MTSKNRKEGWYSTGIGVRLLGIQQEKSLSRKPSSGPFEEVQYVPKAREEGGISPLRGEYLASPKRTIHSLDEDHLLWGKYHWKGGRGA